MGFDELLKEKKVLICCGSGGVGKTTLSAALGVRAAELGLKVLVLTIDPARRLANSLGLEHMDETEKRISPERFPGELYAAMLDMKKTFDDFITRLAPNQTVAKTVLGNHIYVQISTALNGSQEYTALERLLQAATSGKYDLVILDTPPTKHAIDFLNAPVKIHTLFQDNVIRWFLMPFTTLDRLSLGLMNRGTKAAFKAVEKIAGSEFLTTLTEFFTSIRDWQKILRERTAEVHRLLTSSNTGFVLVSGFSSVRIEEARFFERSLKKGGYWLSAIIINRAFPLWIHERIGVSSAPAAPPDETQKIQSYKSEPSYLKLKQFYDELSHFYRSQEDAFRNYVGETRVNVLFARLPDFNQDVHDVNGLKRLADRLNESIVSIGTTPTSPGST